MVLGAFLDSFQKIADAATNTKGKTSKSMYKFEFWLMYCLCSLYILLNRRA
jgi:hypothetical protein